MTIRDTCFCWKEKEKERYAEKQKWGLKKGEKICRNWGTVGELRLPPNRVEKLKEVIPALMSR